MMPCRIVSLQSVRCHYITSGRRSEARLLSKRKWDQRPDMAASLSPSLRAASGKGKTVGYCEHLHFEFGICRNAAGVCSFVPDGWDPLISVTCQSALFARRRSKDSMWAYPFRSCLKACRTRYRPLDGPWLNFPHRRGSPHRPRFEPVPPQPFLKPSSKRPSSVTNASIHWSSTLMMNCSLLSASIQENARASPDMLSGPEHFLEQAGPHITHLPIAISRAELTGDAQPVTRRSTIASMPFASLESRFFLSYLCRVFPPVTPSMFNCIGLVRKSIFRAAVRTHHCRP